MTSFVFVQPHLRFGGAERQTVIVANELVYRGHDVHLVLHSANSGLISEVSEQVYVHDLGLESHLATIDISRRIYQVLKNIPKSFVIVKLWSSILACSLIDNLPGSRHHVFNYCEDLDPNDHAEYIRFGSLKQKLIKKVFRNKQFLSANTQTVADSMVRVYGLDDRPAIIPSTVNPDAVFASAEQHPHDLGPGPNVLTVGSLIQRKGLDVIKGALENTGAEVNWHLVGEGPLRNDLEQYDDPRGKLKIHVHPGNSNPYGYMAAADLLVHGARSEAWGIVLLEAMAVGTPVLAAASIGPVEMNSRLGNEPDIMRVFDPQETGEFERLILERLDRPRISIPRAHNYIAPFTLEKAVDIWQERAEVLLATR